MGRIAIESQAAPRAVGTYSQAVKTEHTIYFSGQIPLVPETMELVEGDIAAQVERVLENLSAVAQEAGGSLDEIARLTVYLTDLSHFPAVNDAIARRFNQPYPARAVVGVAALPLGAHVEIDAIMPTPAGEYRY